MSFSTNEPFSTSSSDKAIGLLIVLTLIGGAIWYALNQNKINPERWLMVHTYLSQSYGIGKDTTVLIAGLTVGKVHNIELTHKGRVKLDILLDKNFYHFYKADSQFKIDSQIGLNTVISGTSLIFEKGESKAAMPDGSVIEIIEPKSIQDLAVEWKLESYANKFSSILDSLNEITSTVNLNQATLNRTIDNIDKSAESLVSISQEVSKLLKTSRTLLITINTSVANIDPKVTTSLENLNQTMKTSEELMLSLKELVSALTVTARSAPETIETANIALNEITNLSKKVGNHWLLGNKSNETIKKQNISVIYPSDKELYSDPKLPSPSHQTKKKVH